MIAIKSPNDLFCDLHNLQRAGVMVDTRLILDDGDGELLDLYGDQQWWSGLGKAGGDNVMEAQQFVDILYGVRKILSNKHFTVIEDTAVAEEFLCMFLLVERQLWHIHAECANYYVNFVNLC